MKVWMENYAQAVQTAFGDRIWFLGLQGSRGRGEAGAQSDIDVVLILDCLPMRELVCGFVSGKGEIEAWEKSELFQFCRDTTPIIGSLENLLATVTTEDLRRAIRMGACNVYHGCAHNMLHGRSAEVLSALYKSAAFTLQAIAYLQTGIYVRCHADLASLLNGADRCILESRMRMKESFAFAAEHFEELSIALLKWASGWIVRIK